MSRKEMALRRSEQVKRQKFTIVLFTFIVIVCGVILGSSMMATSKSQASEESGTFKYYTSIQIQAEDTLWSIAEEYMSDEFDSIQEYIEEIKTLNGLGDDMIHSGQFLMIPYYSNEFR